VFVCVLSDIGYEVSDIGSNLQNNKNKGDNGARRTDRDSQRDRERQTEKDRDMFPSFHTPHTPALRT